MSDEQERLENINGVLKTGSSCLGCYVALILLLATPVILVGVWALVGSVTNSDVAALVGVAVAGTWLVITIARLGGWGR